MPKVKNFHVEGHRQESHSLKEYKAEHLRTARELCYSKEVLKAIEDASSEIAVTRAMIKGRHEMGD